LASLTPLASVARICTLNVAPAVEPAGVPDITPALLKVSPEGNAPAITDHEYGAVPLFAAIVFVYGLPANPFGSVAVAMVVFVVEAVNVMVSFTPFASVTCKLKVNAPTIVGVPTIAPVESTVSPVGSAPFRSDQAYGVVPPVAARVFEYVAPTIPFGIFAVVMCKLLMTNE